MPTQVQFVRKWGVSKGIISRYHNQGMPLTSFDAAEQWVAENVPFGKVHCAAEEARVGPIRLPPETSGTEDDDAELLRVEEERDQLLRSAWKRFKKKPIFDEDAPGFSEAELGFCWAMKGLLANGVAEKEAFDMASFTSIVTGAPDGCGWEPMPERRKKVPAKG
jgi:hypothetical protein